MSFDSFYDSTLKEIRIFIDSHREHEKQQNIMRANLDYVNMINLTSCIGILLSGKGDVPKFENSYKFLFDNGELEEIEKQKEIQQQRLEAEQFRKSMELFTKKTNEKFNK